MKILYLSDSILPSQSANSVHVMKMCESFASLGHDVVLVGLKGEHIEQNIFDHYGVKNSFRVKQNRMPRVPGLLFFHAIYSLALYWQWKPDFVFGRSFFSIYLCSFFCKSFSFETHNPVHTLPRHFKFAFKGIIHSRSMRKLIVISDKLRQIIVSECPELLNSKIQVLHDGASIPPNDSPNRMSLSKGQGLLQIGYVGSIQRGRGLDLLLRLAQELPDMDFHIVGGDQSAIIKNLSLAEFPRNVQCYGFVAPYAANELTRQFDVVLAPYQTDTSVKSGKNTSGYMSPLKIFEYMAAAKAIVCSDLPVLREVFNEKNAILVPAAEVSAWKEAILRLQDPALRNELAHQAYQNFENNFTWTVRAQKVLRNMNNLG
ncbi:MAG: glycosyltransferase family 4 protein [Cyclobacteriaceae bacterium]|nr:glycosyltransferase family 4 protein [Cyclobacteriaceae bacterium]